MRLSSSRCARFERPLEGAGDERGDLAGDLAGDFFGGDLAGDLAARFDFAGEVDLAVDPLRRSVMRFQTHICWCLSWSKVASTLSTTAPHQPPWAI